MEIAKASAGIPWKLFSEGSKLSEITQHPILDLLRRPNAGQGALSFWKAALAYYYISGNMYIEAVRPLTRVAPPVELWTQRPDRIRVVPNAARRVAGYEYTVGAGKITIDAANVLHMLMFDPLDDWYGLSPIVVAAKIIDQMAAANDWNTALFQNGARPDGAFVAAGKLDPDQRVTLREDLRKNYGGSRNARKPLILESGITWQQLGAMPTDLDWLAGKEMQAREIAIAIGVAPELLGDAKNKTYSNVQEARSALYHETVIPLMWEVRDNLNNWLVPMYDDPRLRLDIDISGITALQEDVATKRQFAIDGWKCGLLTLNAALKMIGEEEIDQGDVRIIPNVVTVTPSDKLIPDDEDEDDAIYPLPFALNPAQNPLQLQAPGAGGALQDDSEDAGLYDKALRTIMQIEGKTYGGALHAVRKNRQAVTVARPVQPARIRPKRGDQHGSNRASTIR